MSTEILSRETHLTFSSPECGKAPSPNCVKLKHLYKCPRHPSVYCKEQDGQNCVQCLKRWQGEEQEIQAHNRVRQEAIVSEALANRGETLQPGKAQWGQKLPTAERSAKTAAQKAREAMKRTDALTSPWQGAKGAKMAKHQDQKNTRLDEPLDAKSGKAKGKKELRIQRGY